MPEGYHPYGYHPYGYHPYGEHPYGEHPYGEPGGSVIELSLDREAGDFDLLPDPDAVAADPNLAGSGRYRGRRRSVAGTRPAGPAGRRRAGRPAARWGTAAVVLSVAMLLVGSGVLASYLSDPVTLPVLPPSPTPVPTALTGPPEDESRLGPAGVATATPGASGSPVPVPLPTPGDRPGDTPDGPPTGPEPDPSTPSTSSGQPAPDATGSAPGAAPPPPPSSPPPPASDGCQVTVEVVNQWPGGAQVGYVITNHGATWNGWTLTFTAPSGFEDSGEHWGGAWEQQGSQLTVENLPWNGRVAGDQSVVVGHRADRQPPDLPVSLTGFAVNGTACAS